MTQPAPATYDPRWAKAAALVLRRRTVGSVFWRPFANGILIGATLDATAATAILAPRLLAVLAACWLIGGLTVGHAVRLLIDRQLPDAVFVDPPRFAWRCATWPTVLPAFARLTVLLATRPTAA